MTAGTVLTRAAFALAAVVLAAASSAALAQANNPFGSFKHDSSSPIEVTADSLEVDQGAQKATFSGDVIASQGEMRLNAARIVVSYAGEGGGATGAIDRMRAEGNVFLTTGEETARGDWAEYDVLNAKVEMGGAVTLTQGGNVLKGERLSINIDAGTGAITGGGSGGRVSTTFTPGASK